MPLVGFEQDPSAPEGTGMFQFDDRAPLYARDPQTAADLKRRQPAPPVQPSPELMTAAAPPPDQRTASNGFQTTDQRLAGGGPAPYDAQLAGLPSMAKVPAPAPPPPATGGGPPAPERPQGPMATPQGPQQGPDVQGEAMKFITSPVRMGATQGGYRPVKQSQTVETEGLPYDPELAQQRSDAAINLQVAHMAGAKAQADRALAEQAHWQAQLPEAQKRAAEAQTEMANQQDAYKRERADLDRMITESQDNQKSFNANRWMESRGLIGQIGAVIAQAMGAYAATLSHGENWAKKIIDDAINRDIENQKAQIESGKAGVTNALQKLNLRYGDMNQAQSALKMAMQTNVDTQIQTYAAATKSQDVQQVAGEWLAKNQQDRVTEEQKFMAASMGKRKMETSGQIVAPSAGGMRQPTTAEMSQRADLAGKLPGIAEKTYNAESARQKAYGENPEDNEKVRALVVPDGRGGQVVARSEPEARTLRTNFGLSSSAQEAAKEMKELSKLGTALSPTDQRKYAFARERVMNAINTMAGQGVVREDDVKRWKSDITGNPWSIGASEAAEEVGRVANSMYVAQVDAQQGSHVTESFDKGKPKTSYTGKKATTPSILPPSAKEYGE